MNNQVSAKKGQEDLALKIESLKKGSEDNLKMQITQKDEEARQAQETVNQEF